MSWGKEGLIGVRPALFPWLLSILVMVSVIIIAFPSAFTSFMASEAQGMQNPIIVFRAGSSWYLTLAAWGILLTAIIQHATFEKKQGVALVKCFACCASTPIPPMRGPGAPPIRMLPSDQPLSVGPPPPPRVGDSSPWSAMKDENGDTYYHNSQTNQSQWEKVRGASALAAFAPSVLSHTVTPHPALHIPARKFC